MANFFKKIINAHEKMKKKYSPSYLVYNSASGGAEAEVDDAVSAAITAEREDQEQLRLEQLNQAAVGGLDLGLENTPEIVAGGTARSLTDRRRRRGGSSGTSVASSLGVG